MYRFPNRYGKFSVLMQFLLSFNRQNMSYVMAVNLLFIKNVIYYTPALNSGLVHIWATFITVQWRSDVWIYLQHRRMSVESKCVPEDVMYANFNCKLSMWHEEFAHNTRKVKRVLGNSFTHGMIYIFCAVCTAVQILEHELWRMIICFCRQICQRRHCVSDSIPAVKSCKNYVLLKKEICVCVCLWEREGEKFFVVYVLYNFNPFTIVESIMCDLNEG